MFFGQDMCIGKLVHLRAFQKYIHSNHATDIVESRICIVVYGLVDGSMLERWVYY